MSARSRRGRKRLRKELKRRERQAELARAGGRPPAPLQPRSGPTQIVHHEQQEQYIGPLPHPRTLQQFEDVVPGAAKSLIDQFVEEGKHRREMEKGELALQKHAVETQLRHQGRGQWIGGAIAGGVLCIAAYAVHLGYPGAASIITAANLAGLTTVFMSGRVRVRKRDDESSDPKADEKSLTKPDKTG